MAYTRKLTSGKYQVSIRLKGLKPISQTFQTKKLATEFARKVEGDEKLAHLLGNPVTDIPLFYEVVAEYWKTASLRDPSAKGRIAYWGKIFGNFAMNEISEFMVDDELVKLSQTRSDPTVNRYKSHLSTIFTFFQKHPNWKRARLTNPVRADSVSTYKPSKKMDTYLSEGEQKRLLKACKNSKWDRLYLLVLTALTTGARKGELLGLKWADIDFKARTALLATTKNGKPRLLPLSEAVIAELTKIKFEELNATNGTEIERHKLITGYKVFPSSVSKYSPFDIKKAWLKALDNTGIKCRFHDLRHTAASNYARAGRSLFQIGVLLGHSSTAVTQRYAHLAVKDTQNMVDDVSGWLK